MLYYAAMATLGSVAGCYVIYYLAGKGGEAFLQQADASRAASSGPWRSTGGTGCWR